MPSVVRIRDQTKKDKKKEEKNDEESRKNFYSS